MDTPEKGKLIELAVPNDIEKFNELCKKKGPKGIRLAQWEKEFLPLVKKVKAKLENDEESDLDLVTAYNLSRVYSQGVEGLDWLNKVARVEPNTWVEDAESVRSAVIKANFVLGQYYLEGRKHLGLSVDVKKAQEYFKKVNTLIEKAKKEKQDKGEKWKNPYGGFYTYLEDKKGKLTEGFLTSLPGFQKEFATPKAEKLEPRTPKP